MPFMPKKEAIYKCMYMYNETFVRIHTSLNSGYLGVVGIVH